MLFMFMLNPMFYYVCKRRAAQRHDMCARLLGTHADDLMMRIVYPI